MIIPGNCQACGGRGYFPTLSPGLNIACERCGCTGIEPKPVEEVGNHPNKARSANNRKGTYHNFKHASARVKRRMVGP